jgi:hypothetical protein
LIAPRWCRCRLPGPRGCRTGGAASQAAALPRRHPAPCGADPPSRATAVSTPSTASSTATTSKSSGTLATRRRVSNARCDDNPPDPCLQRPTAKPMRLPQRLRKAILEPHHARPHPQQSRAPHPRTPQSAPGRPARSQPRTPSPERRNSIASPLASQSQRQAPTPPRVAGRRRRPWCRDARDLSGVTVHPQVSSQAI